MPLDGHRFIGILGIRFPLKSNDVYESSQMFIAQFLGRGVWHEIEITVHTGVVGKVLIDPVCELNVANLMGM
jgi:hypothetical protein